MESLQRNFTHMASMSLLTCHNAITDKSLNMK